MSTCGAKYMLLIALSYKIFTYKDLGRTSRSDSTSERRFGADSQERAGARRLRVSVGWMTKHNRNMTSHLSEIPVGVPTSVRRLPRWTGVPGRRDDAQGSRRAKVDSGRHFSHPPNPGFARRPRAAVWKTKEDKP